METGILDIVCQQAEGKPWAGLDIMRKREARHKRLEDLELKDFDIVFQRQIFNAPSFPVANMTKCFEDVIHKFYRNDDSDDGKQEEKVLVIKGGNVLKAIHFTEDGRSFALTHNASLDDEVKVIFNTMMELKAGADLLLKKQHLKCFEKLIVGTLDLYRDGDGRLQVYQPDGSTRPFSGAKIPRDQVLASLWIASQIYVNAPSYRKHMNVEVNDGRYTMGFKANKFYINEDNLDPLEKLVVSDIKKIGDSKKEDFVTKEEYYGKQETKQTIYKSEPREIASSIA